MKVFKINDIPEFSKKERIVVVGVVGKSPYRYPNKTTPLLPSVDCKETGIECHWDERKSILYLHAVTELDTNQLTKVAANLAETDDPESDIDNGHWLVASGNIAMESCRIMGLLFHLCHVVVLSSPTSVFDMGYLQFFKAIDAMRNDLSTQVLSSLSSSSTPGAWQTHGRCCCPRLLFHFRRAPTPLRNSPAALKRLEHAVEDQLYFILRKARIITNVCAKSLFAIPKNEEFVYISGNQTESARDVSSLVRGLVRLCEGAEAEPPTERPGFRQFLQGHIDLAFGEGFDDNVGKYAMSTSFFELPSASSWRAAAQILTPLYLESGKNDEETNALYDALATDVRFSQARCAKVLPIAQASYAEGLPAHYSSQHHAHKLSVALSVVEQMARGPVSRAATRALKNSCDVTHQARRLCEALSLTDHMCVLPVHDSTVEHSSGVRYVAACNCGRRLLPRADPYCARAANLGFYEEAARECGLCAANTAANAAAHHAFPVFQPTTTTYKAASISTKKIGSQEEPEPERDARSGASGVSGSGWSAPDALSPGSHEDEPSPQHYVLPVTDTAPERGLESPESLGGLARQPSTTEYLPGMLHLGSPAGLLPGAAHWALVCVGASSLYSHAAGLPDHLQPGFLPNTNYLVPWDAQTQAQALEPVSQWRGQSSGSRGRGKSNSHHLTVKIFIGYEFECPRGHRFMSPVGSPRSSSSPPPAPPLWQACPCRSPATLQRVHVVTPKAQVHVTLHPKAQPYPGGPVFVPQPPGSPDIRLSAAAYWVLRLPRAYCDERGQLPRPGHLPAGALLAPTFGLTQ